MLGTSLQREGSEQKFSEEVFAGGRSNRKATPPVCCVSRLLVTRPDCNLLLLHENAACRATVAAIMSANIIIQGEGKLKQRFPLISGKACARLVAKRPYPILYICLYFSILS